MSGLALAACTRLLASPFFASRHVTPLFALGLVGLFITDFSSHVWAGISSGSTSFRGGDKRYHVGSEPGTCAAFG